ncbi:alpha/beta-hydrolase [Patellaria atrata CBS 101060]|uniref:Alpha/beta-hydrolase n=1 Tax=Patellaria atrata CBS 101060 TaxID=1346257 RepID=A0A9P4SAV3_9PEZI|nr:alpha/beta-hydrolase [Patellaria atrata CBS 101060]
MRARLVKVNGYPDGIWTDAIPSVLLPPTVLMGLTLTLWTYKSVMLVLFQNKIIYMPSIPPFSRREKISDYAEACKPVLWKERRIKSLDGTEIALCVGNMPIEDGSKQEEKFQNRNHVVILFFQGNASSLPPRLPGLSRTLKLVSSVSKTHDKHLQHTIVGLSYRGFWTSRGRASQRGIEMDAIAALQWVQTTYQVSSIDMKIVIWGQSIGAGVATGLAAHYVDTLNSKQDRVKIAGLILETPFVSIRSMLGALYPQKWLPYRYLGPFLRNWWDNNAALRSIAASGVHIPILMLVAARDEVVPGSQSDELQMLCNELGLDTIRKDIPGALHSEALSKRDAQVAVTDFVQKTYNEPTNIP